MNPIHVAQRIYRDFSETPFGERLETLPRYHRFVPDGFSVEQWEKLIGSDGNNLHHMRQSVTDAMWFIQTENSIRPGSFSYKEAQALSVTAAMHDQGEAIVSDIEYGRKSPEQREKEADILVSHGKSFVPRLGGKILEAYEYGQLIAFGDKLEKLPGAFKTIELMGFMNNTVFGLQQIRRLRHAEAGSRYLRHLGIETESQRETAITALERLTTEVLGSGVVGDLIMYGERFPSAHEYLRTHATQISKGMSEVKTETFDWYDHDDPGATPGEKERRIEKFRMQKQLWEDWSAAQNIQILLNDE